MTVLRTLDDAERQRLVDDAKMSAAADRLGYDKCGQVSCPVLIVREKNRDGFCQFHRRKRSDEVD